MESSGGHKIQTHVVTNFGMAQRNHFALCSVGKMEVVIGERAS